MSGKFNWQAEDDVVWEELPADEKTAASSRKRRRWPFLLLALLLLAGVTFIVLRQINRQVAENSEARRVDIASSHNLLLVADAEKDAELFISLLSGRDSGWTAAQNELFQAGLLLDRAPLGLSAAPGEQIPLAAQDNALNITFSPDLMGAEMVTEQPYTINVGHGLTETVTLQETAVYRLGRERWLLAPPEADFWGPRESQQGARLRVSYPERDAELAARLLPDLERKLDEMCRMLADSGEAPVGYCPSDRPVEIQFSTDPASLTATTQPQAATLTNNSLRVTLPAPTLVGLPLDEAGYQALFRGYASQMVTAIVTQIIGYSCCDRLPFYQVLIDYELAQLSLKPWPVTSGDYERVLNEQVQLTDLSGLWRSEDSTVLAGEEGWRVYAVVDYLLNSNPEISPVRLQRELVRRGSFFGWLNGAFSEQNIGTNSELHSNLMRQFWLQAYPQALQPGGGEQTLLPTQDLQITCAIPDEADPDIQTSMLYRYNLTQRSWIEEYSTPNRLFMNPLPGDDTLLLLEVLTDVGQWQTTVWRDGQSQPIMGTPGQYSVSFAQTDPAGIGMTAFVFPPEGQNANITLFDLSSCDEQGCDQRVLPGIPVWSPDGSQAIFTNQPNTQIGLLQGARRTILFDASADTQALQLYYGSRQDLTEGEPVTAVADLTSIGEGGHAPFWLDNDTVGYVALANGRFSRPGQSIVFTTIGQDNPQKLLTADDLLQEIPEKASIARIFWIHYAMVHPTNPDILFVAAFGAWDQQAHIFSYDRASGEAHYLMSAGYAANHSLELSPDGRYQVLTGLDVDDPDPDRNNALLLLHDLARNETTPFLTVAAEFPPFQSYDWSADGEWLAMMLDTNLVGLYAPQHGALQLVETSAANCASPAWVNR